MSLSDLIPRIEEGEGEDRELDGYTIGPWDSLGCYVDLNGVPVSGPFTTKKAAQEELDRILAAVCRAMENKDE